jgi:hypothetical protein
MSIRNLLFAIVALAFSNIANAVTINFGCITNNNAGDCAIGEAQLSVELTDNGNNQVLFTFFNTGTENSSIQAVYFDDGTLLGIASLIDADDGVGGDSGVDFSVGAAPPVLPGGNTITPVFETTAGFLADADNPAPFRGVNPGESLGVIFDLLAGKTYADTVAALGTDLRIGMHVIAFDSGGSESFVSTVVPVPAAVWLFGSGLLGLVAVSRRKVR